MKQTKICTKCYEEKPLLEFNNGKQYYDGKTPSCKSCIKKAKQIYYEKHKNNIKLKVKAYSIKQSDKISKNKKKYYDDNKETIQKKQKAYKELNKQKIDTYMNSWRQINKEKINKTQKKWIEINKDKIKMIKQKYRKKRKENDPLFKLTENIRTTICNSLKRNGYTKKSKTFQILGCTYDEFKQHLEKQFQPWMSWDNYGQYNGQPEYGWDIDHIIPLKTAITEEDIIRLNHYTNLRPLCSYYNRNVKKDKLIL